MSGFQSLVASIFSGVSRTLGRPVQDEAITSTPHPPAPPTLTQGTVARGRGARVARDASPPPPAPEAPVKVLIQARFGVGHPAAADPLLQTFKHELQGEEDAPDAAGFAQYRRRLERGLPPNEAVEHRFHWMGGIEDLAGVMKMAPFLLTQLKITNCAVGVLDLVAILQQWPTLEGVDIGDVCLSSEQTESLGLQAPRSQVNHHLKSLKITSRVPLDRLFAGVALPSIRSLKLTLLEGADQTRLERLFSSAGPMGPTWEAFELKGEFDAQVPRAISNWIATYDRDVSFTHRHSCNQQRTRAMPNAR